MDQRSWVLYIDESGNFRDEADTVLVGGLLVPAETAKSIRRIRSRLQKRLPWIPWPPHAYYFNRAVFPALVAATWPDRAGVPAAAIEAANLLRARQPALLAPVVEALSANKRPDFRLIVGLDAHVVSYGDVHRKLKALRNETWATLRRELGRFQSAKPASEPPTTLCLAGETHLGDAAGPKLRWGRSEDDRFLGELACLTRRVTDALKHYGCSHRVDIHICERGLTVPGTRQWIQLDADIVRDVAHEATIGTSEIEWTVARVYSFDADVPALLVLADYSVNVSRNTLRHEQVGHHQAETVLGYSLALPIRFSSSSATHVAATGLAQQWVDSALGRSLAPSIPLQVGPGGKQWACDQAQEWLDRVSRKAAV